MTVAYHNLAANMQRRAAEERITGRAAAPSPSGGSSFLARQRQATSRRFNVPGVAQNEFFE